MNLKKLRKNFLAPILVIVALVVFVKRPEVFAPQEDVNSGNSEEVYASVARVIDGDTIEISGGQKVRLLGIDAPERGEPYFDEAKKHLQELTEGKDVRLTKDVRETDKYGRLLRHIYVDEAWINEKMIQDGFARIVTFPPDVAHVDAFTNAQEEAQNQKKGLWRAQQ